MQFPRITHHPQRMGGKPCIRDLRVTVGTVVGLLATQTRERVLEAYPYLEPADLDEALAYAAWQLDRDEVAPPVSDRFGVVQYLPEVTAEVSRYASVHSLKVEISGFYDLFPARGEIELPVVARWGDRWPNGNRRGVYLFFSDAPRPAFLYAGKSSGRTSCIRSRLNDYFDKAAKRNRGVCILLTEWDGYERPWSNPPRFVVTVAVGPDDEMGACPAAAKLERHLIQHMHPTENIQHRASV